MINQQATKPLGLNQIAGLHALINDIGLETFRQSRIPYLVKRGKLEDVADAFMEWVYEDGEESGRLLERRSDQQRLFLLEAF